MIVLRIMLKGSQFLDMLVPEMEARAIVQRFKNGTMDPVFGRPDASKEFWVVRTDDVAAMYTSEVQVSQQPSVPTSSVVVSGYVNQGLPYLSR